MPFAELPGSHMQVPPPPNWTQFGMQANEMIANQPQPNLAGYVQKAVDQIDEIIKESSPLERLKRETQMAYLSSQKGMYEQYKKNPAAFEWRNGSLQYRDRYKSILEAVRLTNMLKAGKLLDKRLAGDENGLDNLLRQESAAFGNTTDSVDDSSVVGDATAGGTEEEDTDSQDAMNDPYGEKY